MAFVYLDQAAEQVGKSEITLRRLIRANKISFEKEKTPTGFVYKVDPKSVLDYYASREEVVSAEVESEKPAEAKKEKKAAEPVEESAPQQHAPVHQY